MASLGKKDYAKRDMNFFSEFAASSQAFARYAGYAIILTIAVIAVTVLVCIWKAVDYKLTDSKVKNYDALFASDEYKGYKVQAEELAIKAANRSQYNYVMNSMKTAVEKETGVSFEIVDDIKAKIPSNVILTAYDVSKGTLIIEGDAHSYYAPTEMINMLKEKTIFTAENLSVQRVNPADLGDSETFVTNYVNAKYHFRFEGSLVTESAVKISYIGPNSVLLKNLDTQWIKAGDVLTLDEIATIEYNGTQYKLDSILVNGKAISADELTTAQTKTDASPNGVYRAFISDDTKIDLYYSAVVIATEEAA